MRLDGDELFFDECEDDEDECDDEDCDLRDEDSYLDSAYEGQNDMDYGDC